MIPNIKSVNHAAYRCRDVVQTRRFYEGVLGLKVKAALAFDQISGTGFDRRYMRIFLKWQMAIILPYSIWSARLKEQDLA